LSTEDEGSDDGVLSTPDASPVSSRAPSPEPSRRDAGDGAFVQVPRNIHNLPQIISPPSFHTNHLPSVTRMPPTYAPFRVTPGQMPFMLNSVQCGDVCNTSVMPICGASINTNNVIPSLMTSPRDGHSSSSSDAGTVSSVRANDSKSSCHLIWCDHRAFKESSSKLKQQLEEESGSQVKTHKTAENCIRLFRKKQRAQGRPPCVILVSWANAPALLAYLDEAEHVWAKVVVLCDARSCRRSDSADQITGQYPNIYRVATSWQEAVDAVADAVGSFV